MIEAEYYACPFCGWVRSLKYGASQRSEAGQPRVVSFTKVDPAQVLVYQKRRLTGAGRGSHNASIQVIEGQHLAELPDELKHDIADQARRILAILE